MSDKLRGKPVYTEPVGLSTAEVYHYRGIYSVLLMGDRVACFLGNSTSLEDCKEEIPEETRQGVRNGVKKRLFSYQSLGGEPSSSWVKGSAPKNGIGILTETFEVYIRKEEGVDNWPSQRSGNPDPIVPDRKVVPFGYCPRVKLNTVARDLADS